MADPIDTLIAVFGGESGAAYGSAVFRVPASPGAERETVAKGVYRAFVGPAWERAGERTWLGSWSKVGGRATGTSPGLLELLAAITDPPTRSAADLLVDGGADPAAARAALAGAFDRPGVGELAIFAIGDGAALSGLLIAAGDPLDRTRAVVLVFLMD